MILPRLSLISRYSRFQLKNLKRGITPISVNVEKSNLFDALVLVDKRYFSDGIKITKTSKDQKDPDEASPCEETRNMENKIREFQHEIRLYHHAAQYEKALEVSSELLEVCTSLYGDSHPVTASAFNNIGVMNKLLGNYNESREAYENSLRIYQDSLGKNHESYAAALNNLALLFRSQSQMDENLKALEKTQLIELSIEYLEEALQVRTNELGKDHPHTLSTKSNLGAAIASQVLQTTRIQKSASKFLKNRSDVAEEHLRQSLQISIKNPKGQKLDDDHHKKKCPNLQIITKVSAGAAQNLALFLKHRADLLRRSGQVVEMNDIQDLMSESKQLYESALYVRSNLLGESHPDTVATMHSLAELLESKGDKKEADAMREDIMKLYDVKEIDKKQFEDLEKERK